LVELTDIKGVGPATSIKLMDAGIKSVAHLSVMRADEIKAMTGVSIKIAKDMIADALDKGQEEITLYDAEEYEEWMDKTIRYIPSGSVKYDTYTSGGWMSMNITGIYGLQAVGKSQLCNTAICLAIDMGLHVLLIETEPNTVNIPRLRSISEARELNWNPKLLHIYPAKYVGTVFGQFRGYLYLEDQAKKNGWDVGLVVVDSFNGKFRRQYSGREMYPDRAAEFGRHLDHLGEMAKDFNAAILLTFQCGVTPDPAGEKADLMKYHGAYYPVGGTICQHNVQTWISLRQRSGGEASDKVYHASITDHNFLPKESFDFEINEYGVKDL
jgi:RecA/RadA recombinase